MRQGEIKSHLIIKLQKYLTHGPFENNSIQWYNENRSEANNAISGIKNVKELYFDKDS